MYLHLDPSDVKLLPSFARDVTSLGHLGTSNFEMNMKSESDLEQIKPEIVRSYMES